MEYYIVSVMETVLLVTFWRSKIGESNNIIQIFVYWIILSHCIHVSWNIIFSYFVFFTLKKKLPFLLHLTTVLQPKKKKEKKKYRIRVRAKENKSWNQNWSLFLHLIKSGWDKFTTFSFITKKTKPAGREANSLRKKERNTWYYCPLH